jgi:hypothetical protein
VGHVPVSSDWEDMASFAHLGAIDCKTGASAVWRALCRSLSAENTVKLAATSFAVVFLYVLTIQAQTTSSFVPAEQGMYVEESGQLRKIIGQIAEFKRSGSLFVSDLTLHIKAEKQNIQLLGANAQTVVSAQPVFYFVPAKQEQSVGINAGDLILIRLEEKTNRRQFEIAARGAWRRSSGITLTHQIQLLRDEVEPDVYKVLPAAELTKGEYALFLDRGENLAPYVYDFSVQPARTIAAREKSNVPTLAAERVRVPVDSKPPPAPEASGRATIGIFAEGNVNVRHDGVALTAVTPGGPADQVGIKAGDAMLAVNDHYIFTIAEMNEAISHLIPGTKIVVRYRRYSSILDVSVVVGAIQ